MALEQDLKEVEGIDFEFGQQFEQCKNNNKARRLVSQGLTCRMCLVGRVDASVCVRDAG